MISMNRHYLIRGLVVVLLLAGLENLGYILPFHSGLAAALKVCLGVVLIGFAIVLGRREESGLWGWIPRTGIAHVYFITTYGILLTWVITCVIWQDSLGDTISASEEFLSKSRHLLTLCFIPPLVGIGVDLLISRWIDTRHKRITRSVGVLALAFVVFVLSLSF